MDDGLYPGAAYHRRRGTATSTSAGPTQGSASTTRAHAAGRGGAPTSSPASARPSTRPHVARRQGANFNTTRRRATSATSRRRRLRAARHRPDAARRLARRRADYMKPHPLRRPPLPQVRVILLTDGAESCMLTNGQDPAPWPRPPRCKTSSPRPQPSRPSSSASASCPGAGAAQPIAAPVGNTPAFFVGDQKDSRTRSHHRRSR